MSEKIYYKKSITLQELLKIAEDVKQRLTRVPWNCVGDPRALERHRRALNKFLEYVQYAIEEKKAAPEAII